MRRLMTILVGMLVFWGSPAPAAGPPGGDSFEIHPRFEAGKVTRSRVSSRTVGTMRMFAFMPEQKFTQLYEQVVQEKCLRVNEDGTAVFEVSMPHVRMEMNMGGMQMAFDSKDDPDAAPATTPADGEPSPIALAAGKPGFAGVARFFRGLSKLTFTYTVDKGGKPLKLEGLSDGLRRLIDEMAGEGVPIHEREMIRKIGEMMTDDQMMENMRLGYRVIPRGMVSPGHRWEHRWDQNMPFLNKAIIGEGEYELLGVEAFEGRRCAKIQVKESMSTGPASQPAGATAENPAPADGGSILDRMDFEVEMTGSGGTAYVDVETGELVKLQQVQDLVVRMSLPADANAQAPEMKQGMKMEQKLKTSVTVALLGDDE